MTFRRLSLNLLLVLSIAGVTAGPLRGLQTSSTPQTDQRADQAATSPASEANAGSGEEDTFRHSPAVKTLGGWMHMDTEGAATTFEYVNFALLAAAVLFGLLKILPGTFRANRAAIQQQLKEARVATEQANVRLAAIETKLEKMDQEIAAIGIQAEKESAEDEVRIKSTIEAERLRITEAAARDIASAGSAAQRELKRFAAGLAVDRARQKIALTDAQDRQIMGEFVQGFSENMRTSRGEN